MGQGSRLKLQCRHPLLRHLSEPTLKIVVEFLNKGQDFPYITVEKFFFPNPSHFMLVVQLLKQRAEHF